MVYSPTENTGKTLKRGFTLIEVSIVLLIAGLFLGLGFGAWRFYKNSQVSATQQKLANLDSLLEMYNVRMGEYPQNLAELIEGPQKPALKRKWAGPLANEADLKDTWGKEFEYNLNPKGSTSPYELKTTSPEGTTIYSPVAKE